MGAEPTMADAVAAWRESQRQRTASEKIACRLYTELTGMELPALVPWTDDDGNLWAISLHAQVRLVKRAEEGANNGD